MVITGSLELRTKDRFEMLSEGDIVFCETGENGVHQFYNHSSEPCTYLDIRTLLGMDVTEYPDSGKVNILSEYEILKRIQKSAILKEKRMCLINGMI